MNNKFTLALFFVFVFSLSFVIAQGLGVPHQFYGTATYNGAAASGMTVEAHIEGANVGSTTTLNTGTYGYDPIFLIKDEGEYKGKTITFHLNGVNTGQTAVFENGASTNLDLSASGTTGDNTGGNNNGGSPGGGSPGGGSPGGGSPSSTSTTQTQNTQTSGEEDEESDLGILETTEETQPNIFSKITGAVIGSGRAKFTIPIIFIVLIGGIAITVYVKRKK